MLRWARRQQVRARCWRLTHRVQSKDVTERPEGRVYAELFHEGVHDFRVRLQREPTLVARTHYGAVDSRPLEAPNELYLLRFGDSTRTIWRICRQLPPTSAHLSFACCCSCCAVWLGCSRTSTAVCYKCTTWCSRYVFDCVTLQHRSRYCIVLHRTGFSRARRQHSQAARTVCIAKIGK